MEIKFIKVVKAVEFEELIIQMDGLKETIGEIEDVEKYLRLAYEAGKNGEELEILRETVHE